jgi:hypothetical protein
MTEPAESVPAIAPASEPPNPFLAPDSACDPSRNADAERDADGIGAPPDWFATSSVTAATPGRRRGGRTRRRRCGYRLVAVVAVAVTATLLGLATDQPAGPPPRPADRARPSTVAPALPEPPGTRHRARGSEARKAPRAPSAPRSRPRPAARTAARPRATRPRRMATRQRPSPASPSPSPLPSPAPHRAPAPTRVIPRAPALPMPVPSNAPPEFM